MKQKILLRLQMDLFGFESFTKFLAIPFDSDNDSVLSLQSLEDPELSFILMNPFQLFEDYSPSPLSEDLKLFGDIPDSDLSYYVIADFKGHYGSFYIKFKSSFSSQCINTCWKTSHLATGRI